MAKQRNPTDKKLDAALVQIAAEQAAWRARRGLPEATSKEAATLALCRWIGENCSDRSADRAARC